MTTGFSFGAKTTAPPTFGTGSITFGTPATQPAPQFGFAASTAPSLFGTPTATTALALKPTGFGAPSTAPSTGFSFGSATSFGAPASTAGTGLSFGAPASTTSVISSPSLGFKPATMTNAGFGFGAPASTAATLGAPPTTALGFGPSVSSTGLTFATPAAAGLSFGTPASSAAPSFGVAASSAPSTGISFGTSTAPSLGLGLGTSAAPSLGAGFGTSTAAPSLGTGFGTSTAAPSLGVGFGTSTAAPSLSFGAATTGGGFSFGTTTPSLGLGSLGTTASTLGLTAATTTSQSAGLGGVAFTQSKTGATASAQKELPPKEQLLPNEFAQLVEQFKNVVQEEKIRSSDVARCSVREYRKVENELDSLNHQFNQVENQLLNNRNLAEQLKYETAKGLQNIEMAHRTQETPPSLQYDNTAPLQFFLEIAENFEREMQVLKMKIDNTEKFVKKCEEPSILTSQDLAVGMKKLHETFVALAGRMQAVHSQVEAQKEVFLQLRKQTIKDSVNPFEKMDKNHEAMKLILKNALKAAPPALASGPTPFNSIAVGSNNMSLAAQQTPQTPFQPPATTTATLGFGLGNTAPTFGTAASNTSTFKPAGFASSPFQLNTSSNFQLQKPPTGNKRGKQ